MLAWNDAQVSSSLQVAKALRLELKKTESDASSVLVQAHRRVAGATLSARAMSRLALGDLWLASLDAEAACDAAPELALAHVRLGEVYEACGGRDGAVRSFQRAAALAPTSIAISKRLEEARAAPAAATPAADGAATLRLRARTRARVRVRRWAHSTCRWTPWTRRGRPPG